MQLICSQIIKIARSITYSILITVAVSLPTMASSNTDIEALAGQCVACHGAKGMSINDSWPNIAGQKKEYLAQEITAFRNGTRENALMMPIVENLSDEDIQALARYFSALDNTAPKSTQENIDGKHVRARCISCHGMQGITVTGLWPNLAGQKKEYLISQLHAFQSGKRQSAIMGVISNELNAQQIADVAEYFSQQPGNPK